MGCSCADSDSTHRAEKQVADLLGSMGLKEVIEQGREVIAEAGRSLGHLNRFDRARGLGFEGEVARIHHDAAVRSNHRAQEQAKTVIDRINHVLDDEGWRSTHLERVRAAFKERGGAKKLEDMRADVRLHLLNDEPGLSASMAELSLSTLDAAIKSAAEGDLTHVVGHLRGVMEHCLRGFQSPDMGRQSVGLELHEKGQGSDKEPPPIGGGADTGWCIALYACLSWAWSSFVFSMLCCNAIPFCWCCIAPAIFAATLLHTFLCVDQFERRCNA
ncbi:hypothetical protein ACN469_05725 [Corallococcus terminator]